VDSLWNEGKRAKEALGHTQAAATAFAGAAEKTGVATAKLGADLGGLTKSSADARALLDALSKAIESVQRFVKVGAPS
jgi:hypothetical protein